MSKVLVIKKDIEEGARDLEILAITIDNRQTTGVYM